MRFSIKYADKIVGTLVVLGLAMLVIVVFMIGRSQRWFKYDYSFYSYFETANGLSKNMSVQYKGFTIGHVKDFNLADDDKVEVIFTIFEEHIDRVKEGSLVEVVSSPIGLGNSFNFYPGTGVKILDEFSIIPDVNSSEGKRMLESGIASKMESSDSISAIVNQANTLLISVTDMLDKITLSISGGEGSEDMPVANILRNLEDITVKLKDPDGTVMRSLDGDGPVYTELTSILTSISGILEDVSRTTHVLPAQLPVFLSDLTVILRDLQDVLTAISNNPLLKGGIPEKVETGPGSSAKELEF